MLVKYRENADCVPVTTGREFIETLVLRITDLRRTQYSILLAEARLEKVIKENAHPVVIKNAEEELKRLQVAVKQDYRHIDSWVASCPRGIQKSNVVGIAPSKPQPKDVDLDDLQTF
ncbi:hypothetical protein H4219_001059 [Mycoemilia scoparia]|uniref:Uncharacterized protein n=1 Tax=Mycoemilia scoparia TaxID=417184 RepID=A0A9W8DWJ4_9FUNG|nr:hypothetical protein H4219_001059 [Mycoemilia scoparia]